MFVRTRFDVYRVLKEEKDKYEVRNKTAINKYLQHYVDKEDVLKFSEKLEDLCDEFAIKNKNGTFTWKGITSFKFAKDNYDLKREEKILGIIVRQDEVKIVVAETDYYGHFETICSRLWKED